MPNNEFGDFQTPRPLAAMVVAALPRRQWAQIIEPTCGTGNILAEAVARFPGVAAVGIEIQPAHAATARATGVRVVEADFFTYPLKEVCGPGGPLLVVGNPPWVTNADLGRWAAANRPARANVVGLVGLAAKTGAANFDVAEFVWQKLLRELAGRAATIALLCKTQVARNVLAHCARQALPVVGATLRAIDARRWFGASVDAGLFVLELGAGRSDYTCAVFESLVAAVPCGRFGVVDGRLVADLDAYAGGRAADGTCPVEWRQGLKHDAAPVMELPGGDVPDVEDDYVFPLLKGVDVARGRLAPARRVIVPQRELGDDTERLREVAPRLWAYLDKHADVLDRRKSSIYRNRPRFSVFGVGPYAFAPFKVAVSGLHKTMEFRLVAPVRGRPVILDDTCYLLPFDDAAEAAVVVALLRSAPVGELLRALAFRDAKRPVTKRLLQRIDLAAVVRLIRRYEVERAAVDHLAAIGVDVPTEAVGETLGRLTTEWASSEKISVAGGNPGGPGRRHGW